jgi:hypothetical protein
VRAKLAQRKKDSELPQNANVRVRARDDDLNVTSSNDDASTSANISSNSNIISPTPSSASSSTSPAAPPSILKRKRKSDMSKNRNDETNPKNDRRSKKVLFDSGTKQANHGKCEARSRTAKQRPPSSPKKRQAPGARKEAYSFQGRCERAAASVAVTPSPKGQHQAAQALQAQFGAEAVMATSATPTPNSTPSSWYVGTNRAIAVDNRSCWSW